MATITKRKSGWSVQIRRKGYQPEYRTLPTKAAAEKWVRERESEIDRGMLLREPKQAWEHFRRAYLTGHDPAAQDRYRAVFQAAINVHHELHDLSPLRIKAIPFNNERVHFLSKEDRDRLIKAYSPHVQPIITMLAFHGPRIQTALQMPWGVNGADIVRESIRLNHTKIR